MSTNCYQIAYQRAASEIAEINAHILQLTRRKELLEKLLGPLERLVHEPASLAVPAAALENSSTDLSAAEAVPPLSPVVVIVESRVVESGSFEAPTMHPQPEDAYEEANGHSISDEDVAGLAYRFWSERGRLHGHHEDDWFRAACELQNSAR